MNRDSQDDRQVGDVRSPTDCTTTYTGMEVTPEEATPFTVTAENARAVTDRYPGMRVLRKKCPLCGSLLVSWRFTEYKTHESDGASENSILTAEKVICPHCKKLTVDDPRMPDNDNPAMEIALFEPNWVRCPHCRRGFKLDSYDWDGERHRWCGQRLIIQ